MAGAWDGDREGLGWGLGIDMLVRLSGLRRSYGANGMNLPPSSATNRRDWLCYLRSIMPIEPPRAYYLVQLGVADGCLRYCRGL